MIGILDFLLVVAGLAVSWQICVAAQPPEQGTQPQRSTPTPVVDPHTPLLWPNETPGMSAALERIGRASGFGSVDRFLEGAKIAYERIVTGFAQGDLSGEMDLMDASVLGAFELVIAERHAYGETVESKLIGFKAVDLVSAGIDGDIATLDVRFVAEMASTIGTGEEHVVDFAETWTFQRRLTSTDPNWVLVATEADE